MHICFEGKSAIQGEFRILADGSMRLFFRPITQKYKHVLAALNEKEKALFSEWQKEIVDKEINPSVTTCQSVIKYDDCIKTDSIRPNLEKYYLDHLREIPEYVYYVSSSRQFNHVSRMLERFVLVKWVQHF